MSDHFNDPAWIFVSHASKDIAAVRKVRNYLEDLGAAPLLFYLKAMTEPEEFWPVIEREIAARKFFLFCDSPAARASEWVQRERGTVESLARGPKIARIDVTDGDFDRQSLTDFVRRTRVFVSYSRGDKEADDYIAAMHARGYQVFFDRWHDDDPTRPAKVSSAMEWVEGAGTFVVLLSTYSADRSGVEEEVRRAIERKLPIIPVLMTPSPAVKDGKIARMLADKVWVGEDADNDHDRIAQLLEALDRTSGTSKSR